jgi:hypothetical protein
MFSLSPGLKQFFLLNFAIFSAKIDFQEGPIGLKNRPKMHEGSILLWPEIGLVFNPLSQKWFTRNRAKRGVTTTTSSQLLLRLQPRAH